MMREASAIPAGGRGMKSWESARYAPRFCIGVDVGQQMDYSAISVVSQHAEQGPWDAQREAYTPVWKLEVRWLERPPLGTAFSSVCRRCAAIRSDPALVIPGEPTLGRAPVFPAIVMDSTGVGLPLVEMFRTQHKIQPIAVCITGGREANVSASGVRLPKQDLIASLSVAFEMQQIKIASGLDLSDDLIGELRAFRAETSAVTGRTRYGTQTDAHDDLLIACALGVWWHQQQRVPVGFARVVGV